MAMIQCPECGQEVSDKAKKCINCGKILIEEVQPRKYCAECGKEISVDSTECPFCGCPVQNETIGNAAVEKVSGFVAKNKKKVTIVAIVVAVILLTGLVLGVLGSRLNEDEQLAYQNAVELKNMMKDPDSFRLYDYMYLLKHFDDNGENDYTYTIFKYGGANGYGAITTDEAIFKNGEYIMDYADEPDEDDSDYIEQLAAKYTISFALLSDDETIWKKVEINVEKIKNKMGLE